MIGLYSRLQLRVPASSGAAERGCARRLIRAFGGNELDRSRFPVDPDPLLPDCPIISRRARMMSTPAESLRTPYAPKHTEGNHTDAT